MQKLWIGLLVCSAGCSEWDLIGKPGTVGDPDTGVPDLPPPPAPGCDEIPEDWDWIASDPFDEEADPVDGIGLPFWDPSASMATWAPIPIPDLDVPVGQDRAYRAEFDLTVLPPALTLDLQSDDGIWVWVNGTFVGHWGGAWQQEGCVNEHAQCYVTTAAPPIDITEHLIVGANVVAARVSNAIANAYFHIIPGCTEAPSTSTTP